MRKLILIGVTLAALIIPSMGYTAVGDDLIRKDKNRVNTLGLVDINGNIRNALSEVDGRIKVDASGSSLTATISGGVYVLDALGNTINPATEDTQLLLDASGNTTVSHLSDILDKATTILNQLEAVGALSQVVQGTAPDGDVPLGNPNYVAGIDEGGKIQPLKLASTGEILTIVKSSPSDARSNSSFQGKLLANDTTSASLAIAPYYFNGSTWDRWRGSAADGAWSHIKAIDVPVTVINEPNVTDHETKIGEYLTTQTGTVQWTPAAGKKIILFGVWASSDTAGSRLQVDGSTFGRVVPIAYVTKDGGYVIPMGMCPIWVGVADETLAITTNAGDPDVSVLLIGYER